MKGRHDWDQLLGYGKRKKSGGREAKEEGVRESSGVYSFMRKRMEKYSHKTRKWIGQTTTTIKSPNNNNDNNNKTSPLDFLIPAALW